MGVASDHKIQVTAIIIISDAMNIDSWGDQAPDKQFPCKMVFDPEIALDMVTAI